MSESTTSQKSLLIDKIQLERHEDEFYSFLEDKLNGIKETSDVDPYRSTIRVKTIGLIGGMGWESTMEYYKLINMGI